MTWIELDFFAIGIVIILFSIIHFCKDRRVASHCLLHPTSQGLVIVWRMEKGVVFRERLAGTDVAHGCMGEVLPSTSCPEPSMEKCEHSCGLEFCCTCLFCHCLFRNDRLFLFDRGLIVV